MKKCLYVLSLLVFPLSLVAERISPEMALQRLIEGNKRFYTDQSVHPDRTAERRQETTSLQKPFAAILGCSDSRVAPEIIFDQGIGDLFIVRVAGNVVGPVELDSVEYSAIYLDSSVVVVLGHENCGAIKAVMAGQTKHVETVAELILPAIKKVPKDQVERAIKENVKNSVARIRQSPSIKELIEKKSLKVVPAYYNFHTGEMELLE